MVDLFGPTIYKRVSDLNSVRTSVDNVNPPAPREVTRIGFDVDDTISANPEFYKKLSQDMYEKGGSVTIISSRSENQEVRRGTIEQLRDWEIRYGNLYLFRPADEIAHICPYPELDWYQRYLWQKIYWCMYERVDKYYDDDEKVIQLFKSHATEIIIIDAKTM